MPASLLWYRTLRGIEMNKLMRKLRQDHQGLRKILALLNHKLQELEKGIPPNYSLIEDAINYIENYAGSYHHPTEDVIYQYVIEHGMDDQGHFAGIIAEHKKFAELTLALKDSLQAILMDIIIPREEFTGHLRDYIQAEQSHLDKEDKLIFPLLDNLLSEENWLQITVNKPVPVADPLFGEQVQMKFQELYQRLTEMDDN
jgi:hemerythrin-like domain-containing protein